MLSNVLRKLFTLSRGSTTKESTAIKFGRDAIRDYWTNNRDVSGSFSGSDIETFSAKLMDEVVKIASSPDPRMSNREKLASYVFDYSKFQVLLLKAPPDEDVTGLRGQPGITGELKAHCVELFERDKDLRSLLETGEGTLNQQNVLAAADTGYRLAFAGSHVFHLLRSAFADANVDPDCSRDWFRPFVAIMCSWHEAGFRRELKMPPSLPGSETEASSAAMFLSGFWSCVLEGAQFPDREWRRRMESDEQIRIMPGVRAWLDNGKAYG